MTYVNQPGARSGDLFGAIQTQLADQAARAAAAEPSEADHGATDHMVDQVSQYASDPAYRAGLTDSQHVWHMRTAGWLHARGKLPLDVADALELPDHRGGIRVPREAPTSLYSTGDAA